MEDDNSLVFDELNEESSIESSIDSQDDFDNSHEVDDSDLDSDVESGRYRRSMDTDSVESPILSDSDLSETLNEDDSDASSSSEGPSGNTPFELQTLLSSTSVPLSKITEHTRETSTSHHTNSQADERSSFALTPTGLTKPSARLSHRLSAKGRKSKESSLPATVIEWDMGTELKERLDRMKLPHSSSGRDVKAQKV